jgi:hypothetical protein
VRRHAAPLVAHAHGEPRRAIRLLRLHRGAHAHRLSFTEAACVGDSVLHHLCDAVAVALHQRRQRVILGQALPADAGAARGQAARLQHVADHGGRIKDVALQRQLPRLDLGRSQHIAHDPVDEAALRARDGHDAC